jgi:hypothetical protein
MSAPGGGELSATPSHTRSTRACMLHFRRPGTPRRAHTGGLGPEHIPIAPRYPTMYAPASAEGHARGMGRNKDQRRPPVVPMSCAWAAHFSSRQMVGCPYLENLPLLGLLDKGIVMVHTASGFAYVHQRGVRDSRAPMRKELSEVKLHIKQHAMSSVHEPLLHFGVLSGFPCRLRVHPSSLPPPHE